MGKGKARRRGGVRSSEDLDDPVVQGVPAHAAVVEDAVVVPVRRPDVDEVALGPRGPLPPHALVADADARADGLVGVGRARDRGERVAEQGLARRHRGMPLANSSRIFDITSHARRRRPDADA